MKRFVLAVVFGTLLTFGGMILAVMTINRNMMPAPTGPVHPVTTSLLEEAKKMASKSAPDFVLTDSNGKQVRLSKVYDTAPTFIYFIKDGCPCSTDAEPMFHKLYALLNPANEPVKVNFVGVINGDQKVAAKWASRFGTPYPVLASPDHKVMKAYDAPSSVFNSLVSKQGIIQKTWPGWSRRILKEINTEASEMLGRQPEKFDTAYAPIDDSTGCTFDE